MCRENLIGGSPDSGSKTSKSERDLGLSLAFYAGRDSRLSSLGGLLALFRRRGGEGQQENQGSRITDQDRAVLVKTVQYLLFFRMGKTCKVCGRKFGLVKSDTERRVFSS